MKDNKKKNPQPEKPTVAPDIRWVRNMTTVTKSIGNTDILPGHKAQVDVRPGTIAHLLIEQGQLAIVTKTSRAVEKVSDTIHRVLTREDAEPSVPTVRVGEAANGGNLPEVDLYKCPWCGESFNQSDMARGHIVMKHHAPICRYYSDVVAGFLDSEG